MPLKDLKGLELQVVKVERVVLFERGDVLGVDLAEHLLFDAASLQLAAGLTRRARGLDLADPCADRRRLEAGRVVAGLLDELPQELIAVCGVIDRVVARPATTQALDLTAQDAGAHRVEGRDPGPALADEARSPLSHLTRGLVREGDRQDRLRWDSVVQDEVGDPARDDPSLSGAWTRDDQERAVGVGDGGALLLVQASEEVLARGCRARCARPPPELLLFACFAHSDNDSSLSEATLQPRLL